MGIFSSLFGQQEPNSTLIKRLKTLEEAVIEIEGDMTSIRMQLARINGRKGAEVRHNTTEKDRVLEALAKDLGLDRYIDLTDDIKQRKMSDAIATANN
jgi:hypothetical protein